MLVSREVHAFVDWDTSRRCSWLPPLEAAKVHKRGAGAELQAVYDLLGRTAAGLFEGRIRMKVRFYHGWHRGKTPTPDRVALAGLDPERRTSGSVLLDPPIIVDVLACGAQLRDTLRARDDGSLEQKMVDTALCVDLLWLARTEATKRESVAFMVLSEDDDMVPAVLTANQWGFWAKVVRLRAVNRAMPHTRSCVHTLVREVE